ncbi:MAG: hypothetical protein ACXW2G_02030 [Burkholderiaceae bacterium]
MSVGAKLKEELRSVALYTVFFGAWFAMFLVLKTLVLAEYEIRFSGLSAVFIGALILAKVVLLLEHVSLGEGIARRPAWVEVVVRTVLYAFGVLVVLLMEKAFEVRHEQGGVLNALASILHHEDMPHVMANAIVAACALLVFNVLSLLRKRFGPGGLFAMLRAPSGRVR